MTGQEVINLVFSFLGGGLVVAIVDWVRSARSERTARAVTHLTEQLNALYGPLYYFISQNNSFMKVSGVIDRAYREEYCDKRWSDDETTQKSIKAETQTTIELGNCYSKLMRENNSRMVDILQANFGLIDPQDADMFQGFVTHYIRYSVESGDTCPPFRIQQHLGNITIYRSDFADVIKARFHDKKNELDRVRRAAPWWQRSRPTEAAIPNWEVLTEKK